MCNQNFYIFSYDPGKVRIVEWDGYSRKAWYELHEEYQYEMVLDTPKDEQTVMVHVRCSYEGEHNPSVNVDIQLDGKKLWGHGEDYLWSDVFADLQAQLLEGTSIKCCLTCRHGNMCLVGGWPGELFCTKNKLITQKRELYFYTEEDVECQKRSRQYTDVCEAYQEQNDECFTYNDYLFYLKEGHK